MSASDSPFSLTLATLQSFSTLTNPCDERKLSTALQENASMVDNLVDFCEKTLLGDIIAATQDNEFTDKEEGSSKEQLGIICEEYYQIISSLSNLLPNVPLLQDSPGAGIICSSVLEHLSEAMGKEGRRENNTIKKNKKNKKIKK
ncbi:hypothetical protein RFI_09805 [Reticulomyxa filosa]|uniref:Uncharacterized protein n=1 Tax=Reticulomyxa filosa TaxID=46433 RepID=X6NNP4_RETFI|nr:hypothetical protein RFI_09805 [Reticulomyxa filosa]|eukprot:ETO27329.1 hypothetical protein RFI_09805 [Reticulomyxa filosa]